jgi:hypothetical protein
MNNGTIFEEYPLRTRKYLFYGICIWVRILLAIGVWYLAERASHKFSRYIHILVACVSLFAVVNLSKSLKNPNQPWWSRSMHLKFSQLLLLVSTLNVIYQLLKFYKISIEEFYMNLYFMDEIIISQPAGIIYASIMLLDVFIGVIYSFSKFR